VSARTAARLGWLLFALAALLLVPAAVLNLRRPQYADISFTTGELALGVAFLGFGWFGALIVSRWPANPIGWLLSALTTLAAEYAVYGLITRPGAAPGAGALAWLASWQFAPSSVCC